MPLAGSLAGLGDEFGPVADATARAAGAMDRLAGIFGGLVGVQNPTEAEIMRRQFTREGGAVGRVGVQNVTEAEIQRRQFARVTPVVGRAWADYALTGVGSVNATQA